MKKKINLVLSAPNNVPTKRLIPINRILTEFAKMTSLPPVSPVQVGFASLDRHHDSKPKQKKETKDGSRTKGDDALFFRALLHGKQH